VYLVGGRHPVRVSAEFKLAQGQMSHSSRMP
jgi:hypothetical protein